MRDATTALEGGRTRRVSTEALQTTQTWLEITVTCQYMPKGAEATNMHEEQCRCVGRLRISTSKSPFPFNASFQSSLQPNQVVQYYRASSVALTLDEYNNSATFSSNQNTIDTPLPSNIDTTLLNCLNQTIALSVPLADGVPPFLAVPSVPVFVLLGFMVISCISSFV